MKTTLIPLLALCASLAACEVVPVFPVPVIAPAGGPPGCPPGQAKKGNCAPDTDRGFCPPGQAKKGNC